MKTLVLKTKLKIKPVYFTAAVETFKRLTAEREEFRWDEGKEIDAASPKVQNNKLAREKLQDQP
ncbi:unnamed protein product [Arabidopsis thaliana]|uniref:Uncharacterized protein n=1 Tax=Arabidopsis thaliana TaxID=3702 RepID=A0A5S9XG57_ARATH|nr:unnamed protein product [Arabidopsis thaliana]